MWTYSHPGVHIGNPRLETDTLGRLTDFREDTGFLFSASGIRSGACQNSGVTVVSIERGRVFLVKDFFFDLGENFRRSWSVA